MLWIHGGGFGSGSGSGELYSPDFLLAHDVVVVTINYRLGLLGLEVFAKKLNFQTNSKQVSLDWKIHH